MGCCGKPDEIKVRQHEPDFKGPIKNRSCTDIICCLIFFICVLALLLLAVYAYVYGDPRRIIFPTDSAGLVCGVQVKGRSKLFFFDMLTCLRLGISNVQKLGCPTPQVCVKECPDYAWTWIESFAKEKAAGVGSDTAGRHKMICLNGTNGADPKYIKTDIKSLIDNDKCAAYIIPLSPVLGRCFPKAIKDILKKGSTLVDSNNNPLKNQNNENINGSQVDQGSKELKLFLSIAAVGQKVLDDIIAAYPYILIFLAIAMLVALLWIVLLRFFAGVMVVITIIGFVGLFVFSTVWCFLRYKRLKENPVVDPTESVRVTSNVSYYFSLPTTWLVLGIVSAVVLGITVLLLLFLRERIRIAIALIRETSKALSHMMLALLWPLAPFIGQLVVLALWLGIAIYLFTFGAAVGAQLPQYREAYNTSTKGSEQEIKRMIVDAVPCDPGKNDTTAGKICHFIKYGDSSLTIWFQLFNLFMFLWLMNFVVAVGHMTLAGAFAAYYWAAVKPRDIPAFPLLASLGRALRYHTGSMAFGSLILAIIQLIRLALEYLDSKLKGAQNPIAQFLLKCLMCCFWCLENVIKFLNKNAYIIIAIYGKSFCAAARDAFSLIARNLVRVVVVDKVTDYVLFIGKLVVTVGVGALSYFYFDGTLHSHLSWLPRSASLTYSFVPVIVVVIGAYFISAAFFGVYDMGVDTLFLCFLEDLERNDGSPEKPYRMSGELMSILGKKNQKVKEPKPD